MRMMLENSSTAQGPCGKAALAPLTRLSMVEQKERDRARRLSSLIGTNHVPNLRILYCIFPTCIERVQIDTKVSRALVTPFPASAAAGGVVAAGGSGRGKLL